jgi:hypothetical protein
MQLSNSKSSNLKSSVNSHNQSDTINSLWDSIEGSYQIDKFLGEGSFGQVIKARCLNT